VSRRALNAHPPPNCIVNPTARPPPHSELPIFVGRCRCPVARRWVSAPQDILRPCIELQSAESLRGRSIDGPIDGLNTVAMLFWRSHFPH
jgi:hypothetical protein